MKNATDHLYPRRTSVKWDTVGIVSKKEGADINLINIPYRFSGITSEFTFTHLSFNRSPNLNLLNQFELIR